MVVSNFLEVVNNRLPNRWWYVVLNNYKEGFFFSFSSSSLVESAHLHLFVPTLLLPANQGSRMKMQRNVSLRRIPRSSAGLSESLRPLRNQCTVCFFRELFRVIFLTEAVQLHHHAGNGQLGGWGSFQLYNWSAGHRRDCQTHSFSSLCARLLFPNPHWLVRFFCSFQSSPPIGWEAHVARLDVTLAHCCSAASQVPFRVESLHKATSLYRSIRNRHRTRHLHKTGARVVGGGGQLQIYVMSLCRWFSPNNLVLSTQQKTQHVVWTQRRRCFIECRIFLQI